MLDKMLDAASACFGGPAIPPSPQGHLPSRSYSSPLSGSDASDNSGRSSGDTFCRMQSADSVGLPTGAFVGRSGKIYKVYVAVDTSQAVPEPPLRKPLLGAGHLTIVAKHIRNTRLPVPRET